MPQKTILIADDELDGGVARPVKGGPIVLYVVIVVMAIMLSVSAEAQVHVDIGINLPAPPQLVVIPEVRTVQYAPAAPANLFVYGGQYWAFADGGWYAGSSYNGPWIVVAPQFVPRPVLLVSVNYYRVPPGHWKQQHGKPPRWDGEWGREWADKREWKHRGKDRDDDDQGEDRGRGHGRE